MGIGRALALGLAGLGVNLVLNARTRDLLDQTAFQCSKQGVTARAVCGDISRPETAVCCVEKARESGRLTGFIHAAGLLNPGPYIWELGYQEFSGVFDVNVLASFTLIREVVPLLIPAGQGLAVFIGSGAAEITQPGIAAYCAAKSAQEHLARQLAAETRAVTCFVYRPGIVETRMQEQARQARGGGARELHRVFRPWKEKGQLLSPEQSAQGLINILKNNPHKHHGKTVTWTP